MPMCQESLPFSFMAAPALRALLSSNFLSEVKMSYRATKVLRAEVGACILTVMIHVLIVLFPHFIDKN